MSVGQRKITIKLDKSKANTSSMKKGVLKKKIVASQEEGQEEVHQFFAFYGFPAEAHPHAACSLIHEYINDYLGEFQLEVCGSACADGIQAVAVKYNDANAEALDAKIFEMKEKCVYGGRFLSAVVVDDIAAFSVPIDVDDVATKVDAGILKAGVQAKPRSKDKYLTYFSNMATPERLQVLHQDQQRVHEVLTRSGSSSSSGASRALPPPLPTFGESGPSLSDIFSAVTSLTAVVQDLQSTVVTRDVLQEYHAAQQAENKTYIDQTIAPLVAQQVDTNHRVEELERQVSNLASGPARDPQLAATLRRQQDTIDKMDSANKCITFVGFNTTDELRRRCMIEAFMNTHMQSIGVKFVTIGTILRGPYPNTASKTSYVEFVNKQDRERAFKELMEKKHILNDDDGTPLRICRMKTEKQVHRNFALHKARELIDNKSGKKSEIRWLIENSSERHVCLDDIPVFIQKKNDMTGAFVDNFKDLVIE